MNRPLWGQLVTALCLTSTLQAQEEPCDARHSLLEATRFMESGKEAQRVVQSLDRGLVCAPDELKYRYHFARALSLLQLGRVDDAIRDIRAAQEWSLSDEESRRATDLEQVVLGTFSRVTFTLPDNAEVTPDVQIEEVNPASLPDVGPLKELAPAAQQRYVEKSYVSAVAAAQRVLDAAEIHPLQVWLPHGAYVLDTGQVITIAPGGSQVVVNVATGVRWPDHSVMISPAFLTSYRIGTGDYDATALRMSVGLEVMATQRLEALPRVNFFATAAWLPSYGEREIVDDQNRRIAPTDQTVSWSADQGALTFGVGAELPVALGGRKLFLVPGLELKALSLTDQDVILYREEETPSGPPSTARYQELGWGGAGPEARLRLHARVVETPERRMDLTVGVSGGLVGGLYGAELTGVVVSEGIVYLAPSTEEGDPPEERELPPGIYSAPDALAGFTWTAVGGLTLGVSALF